MTGSLPAASASSSIIVSITNPVWLWRELREKHGIHLSYTWVKAALQGAGLVKKRRRRALIVGGACVGRCRECCCTRMAVAIAGFRMIAGTTCWSCSTMPTARSIYAQLVEEESTRTVMAALREVVEHQGTFCALYSDRASHFFKRPRRAERSILSGSRKWVERCRSWAFT